MAFAFDVNCDTIRGCSCYGSLLWVESSMGWGCDREPETLLTASWCLYNFYIEFKIKQQSKCGEKHIWLILIAILDASCHTCCLHGFQTEVLGNTRYLSKKDIRCFLSRVDWEMVWTSLAGQVASLTNIWSLLPGRPHPRMVNWNQLQNVPAQVLYIDSTTLRRCHGSRILSLCALLPISHLFFLQKWFVSMKSLGPLDLH